MCSNFSNLQNNPTKTNNNTSTTGLAPNPSGPVQEIDRNESDGAGIAQKYMYPCDFCARVGEGYGTRGRGGDFGSQGHSSECDLPKL